MKRLSTICITNFETAKESSRTKMAPQSFRYGAGMKVVPSEDEIRDLFVSEYRENDPRCAMLVRQIILCHQARNSPKRRKIVEAIKLSKEWWRIAPTWEKFVRRALAWSAFAKSPALGHRSEAGHNIDKYVYENPVDAVWNWLNVTLKMKVACLTSDQRMELAECLANYADKLCTEPLSSEASS
jgi:hypothetical protein